MHLTLFRIRFHYAILEARSSDFLLADPKSLTKSFKSQSLTRISDSKDDTADCAELSPKLIIAVKVEEAWPQICF